MKLVLPFALLALVLSVCNLTGKRSSNNSNSAGGEHPTSTTNRDANSATSEDAALIQLIALEYQWKQARAAGDSATLQKVFADEFTNTDPNGKTYNKAQWIDVFKGGEPEVKSWKISEAKLVSFGGDTATMTFTIAYTLKHGGPTRLRDTDTFVRRDGRWQVVASQSTDLK
jgi:ketosteroid isomerase-like protein